MKTVKISFAINYQLIKPYCDKKFKNMFKETFLKLFWTNIHKKHCEKLATKPTSVLLIFTTFYQYEKKFSELSNLKTSK